MSKRLQIVSLLLAMAIYSWAQVSFPIHLMTEKAATMTDADLLDVSLHSAASNNSQLRVVNVTGTEKVTEYPLADGTTHFTTSVAKMSPGIYQVTLLEDNKVVDTKKVVR